MERKIRKFLWSKSSHKKSYHLVNWELCCKPKEEGGLGFKQLAWMNRALLSKWCWRFGRDQSSLWRSLVQQKFGRSSTCWAPSVSRLSQGTGCWKRLLSGTARFYDHVRFEVGSGAETRLWLDHWVDGDTLANLFPNLFAISKQKYLSISKFIDVDLEWSFTFRRVLAVEELDDLQILLAILGPSNRFINQQEDKRIWIPDSNGFSVSSCYLALTKTLQPVQFPHRFIWNKKIPSKTNFFMWTAAHNKCLTVDNLHKRDHQIVSRCPFCKSCVETIDHLLLHCTVIREIWISFFPLPKLQWVMPRSLADLAYCWITLPLWTPKAKILWKLLPSAICWNVWLERNARSLKGKESSIFILKNNIRASILAWSALEDDCQGLRFQDLVFDWDDIFA